MDAWKQDEDPQTAAARCQQASHCVADAQSPCYRYRDAQSFAMGILGDLHLEPDKMDLHEEARRQLRERLQETDPQVCSLMAPGSSWRFVCGSCRRRQIATNHSNLSQRCRSIKVKIDQVCYQLG